MVLETGKGREEGKEREHVKLYMSTYMLKCMRMFTYCLWGESLLISIFCFALSIMMDRLFAWPHLGFIIWIAGPIAHLGLILTVAVPVGPENASYILPGLLFMHVLMVFIMVAIVQRPMFVLPLSHNCSTLVKSFNASTPFANLLRKR